MFVVADALKCEMRVDDSLIGSSDMADTFVSSGTFIQDLKHSVQAIRAAA